MSLVNKVAIVTGASSGIGAAIALKFAAEGAKLAIVGRNETRLKNVSEKCAQHGNTPLQIIADVSKDESAKRIVNETLNKFGQIDILVNNAGVGFTTKILAPDALEVFDTVMATNLRSVISLTHFAGPHLTKTKGNIVNISSIAALRPFSLAGFAYNTVKAGLDHFTRTSAVELGENSVRVNSVNPGVVRTDIIKNIGADEETEEKLLEKARNRTVLKKISQPEEIADVVLFLASDRARSITGASFVVDNGRMLV